jgi:hypothetical protein
MLPVGCSRELAPVLFWWRPQRESAVVTNPFSEGFGDLTVARRKRTPSKRHLKMVIEIGGFTNPPAM